MSEPNSLLVVAIVLATLGAIFLVLRAVTVWAAPPSTGPRRALPMFSSPTDTRPPWAMFTNPEAAADAGTGPDDEADRDKGEGRRWGPAGDKEL